jgi:isopenicillin N synthase-like dioxygenase
MLWQEPEIGALQVLNQDNKWIDAPPIPGTLVMKYVSWIGKTPDYGLTCGSIGDQFARWTSTSLNVPRAVGCA